MTNLRLEPTGIDVVTRRLTAMQTRAGEAQRAVLSPFGAEYQGELIEAGPTGKGPADKRKRLNQNYERTETATATRAEVRIRNRSPWLKYVLKGRGPVVAKKAKVLRFEILGEVFFRRSVGPAKANDFPAKVKARMAGEVRALGQALGAAVIRAYRGG